MKKLIDLMKLLLPGLVLAFVVYIVVTGTGNLQKGRNDEARTQLEAAIRRAAVSCYSAEGAYPESIDYLKEHYGLQIDEKNYVVFYEVFAKNLMPDITVLDNIYAGH